MYYHLGFNQVYPDGEIMVDNSEETTDISRLFKTFVEIKEVYETTEEVNQRLSILREEYRVKTPQLPLVDGSIVLEYQDAFMIKKQVVYREIKRDAVIGSIRAGKRHIEKNSEKIPGAKPLHWTKVLGHSLVKDVSLEWGIPALKETY